MRVIVYINASNKRSIHVGKAAADGIAKMGDQVRVENANNYNGRLYDAAVFYSLGGNLKRVFKEYIQAGRSAVHIDLGIWHRKRTDHDIEGYHKVTVNNLYAEHLWNDTFPDDRFRALGVDVLPKQTAGDHILLVGISSKACWAHDLSFEQWERYTLQRIRRRTDQKVVYRPKRGSDKLASNLTGHWSDWRHESIDQALDQCSVAVCRHSNVALDALVRGVPFFVERGVALDCACSMDNIANPTFPDDHKRQQALNRAAYAQWTVEELREGVAWKFLRDRGYVA